MDILVTFESRHECTEIVAREIAETLRAEGHEVIVADVEALDDLPSRDTLMLGSAEYLAKRLDLARVLPEGLLTEGAENPA